MSNPATERAEKPREICGILAMRPDFSGPYGPVRASFRAEQATWLVQRRENPLESSGGNPNRRSIWRIPVFFEEIKMKRKLACTLFVSAFLFAAARIPTLADDSRETGALKKFYDWYIAHSADPWPHFCQTKDLFDPGLFLLIQKGVLGSSTDHESIDLDPFTSVTSGEVGSWASYALGAPMVKRGDVYVPVALIPIAASWRPHLTAILRKSASGDYLIYDFAYDSFNLRGKLQGGANLLVEASASLKQC